MAPPPTSAGIRARRVARRRRFTPSRWSSARRPSRVERDDRVEVLRARARGRATRGGTHAKRSSSAHGSRDARGHHLLREDVERRARLRRAVERRPPHGAEQRRRRRPVPRASAGRCVPSARARARVPSGRRAGGSVAIDGRHPDLDHEVDVADVDPEFERRRRDQRLAARRLQPLLGVEAPVLREAPVVARDDAPAPSSSPSRAPRRSASWRVLTNTSVVRCSRTSVRDPLVDLVPDLVRAHRLERRRRHLDRDVESRAGAPRRRARHSRPTPRRGTAPRPRAASGSPRARSAARVPRGARAARARARGAMPRLSPSTAWISSTITVRHGREHRAARPRGEQDVERLRRRHEHVRRPRRHRGALLRRRVAGPHEHAHVGQRRVAPRGSRASGAARFFWTSLPSALSGET